MRTSWYDRQGPAAEVLRIGEAPTPRPGPREVRVRVTVSGVNPGDTKKRRGWLGSQMPYPRVVPHSDAAGVVDAVGDGVASRRTRVGAVRGERGEYAGFCAVWWCGGCRRGIERLRRGAWREAARWAGV